MLPSMELMLASSFGRYDHMTVGRVLPEARDGVLVALPGRAVDDSDLKTLPFEEGLNGRLCLDFKRAILASKVGQPARTAASPPLGLTRRLLAGNALVPHLLGDEPLKQKIGEDFDTLWSEPSGRRYPVHGA